MNKARNIKSDGRCSTCRFFLSLEKVKDTMPSFLGTCVNCKSKYCTVFHKPYIGNKTFCDEYDYKFAATNVTI